MSSYRQLFDEPGLKGRRRIRFWTAAWILMLATLSCYVILKLSKAGQFDMAKWAPIIDPHNENFLPLWRILGLGLGRTLTAAVFAIVLSLILGTLLAVAFLKASRFSRIPLIGLIELLRGLPLVITIYFVARVLPDFGINFDWAPGGTYLWYLVIGLTIYNTVIIAEIVRSGIASLPAGQEEAALSIGLTHAQTMRIILLPQAIRVILPALVSQLIIVLKDTSLAALVLGRYQELLRGGSLAIQELRNPLQLFFVIALIYIVINLVLSLIAGFLNSYFSTRTPRKPRAGSEPISMSGNIGISNN